MLRIHHNVRFSVDTSTASLPEDFGRIFLRFLRVAALLVRQWIHADVRLWTFF